MSYDLYKALKESRAEAWRPKLKSNKEQKANCDLRKALKELRLEVANSIPVTFLD